MQSVKGCHPGTSCMLLRQLDAAFKRHFRHAHLNPKAALAIVFKGGVKRLRLAVRDVALKKTPGDGMCPFRTMEWREPNTGMLSQQTTGLWGVLVGYI